MSRETKSRDASRLFSVPPEVSGTASSAPGRRRSNERYPRTGRCLTPIPSQVSAPHRRTMRVRTRIAIIHRVPRLAGDSAVRERGSRPPRAGGRRRQGRSARGGPRGLHRSRRSSGGHQRRQRQGKRDEAGLQADLRDVGGQYRRCWYDPALAPEFLSAARPRADARRRRHPRSRAPRTPDWPPGCGGRNPRSPCARSDRAPPRACARRDHRR